VIGPTEAPGINPWWLLVAFAVGYGLRGWLAVIHERQRKLLSPMREDAADWMDSTIDGRRNT
jgi:hypothetical protein